MCFKNESNTICTNFDSHRSPKLNHHRLGINMMLPIYLNLDYSLDLYGSQQVFFVSLC